MEGKRVKTLIVVLILVVIMFGEASLVKSYDCCLQCLEDCRYDWGLDKECLRRCIFMCPVDCSKLFGGTYLFSPSIMSFNVINICVHLYI